MKAFLAIQIFAIASLFSVEVETIRLKPAPNMTRGELHFVNTVSNPKAVLVICPGHNGTGKTLIQDRVWIEFARTHSLGLMSISFASDPALLDSGEGYPYAADGSGAILLEAVKKKYGKDLRLLLYGFSSGAFFTELFADWKPERVVAWSAHATGWCGPQSYNDVPGLISCGEMDETRYGGAIMYFKSGRAQGKRLLWLSLAGLSHSVSSRQEDLARRFFSSVLRDKLNTGLWVDVDRKSVLSIKDATKFPSLAGWIPDEGFLDAWQALHSP